MAAAPSGMARSHRPLAKRRAGARRLIHAGSVSNSMSSSWRWVNVYTIAMTPAALPALAPNLPDPLSTLLRRMRGLLLGLVRMPFRKPTTPPRTRPLK